MGQDNPQRRSHLTDMYLFHPHIASLYSSAGFAWLLLALLVCAVVTRVSYPLFLHDCVSVVFSRIARRYSDTTRPATIVFSHLFLLGTLAMCLWLCLYADGPLHWLHYGMTAGLVVVWLLMRFLLLRFLGYVFSFRHEAQAVHEDSLSLLMLVAMVQYVACCLAPLISAQDVFRWIATGVAGVYLTTLTGKMVVTYARSFRTLFYICLYILTVEILPPAALYLIAFQISTIE